MLRQNAQLMLTREQHMGGDQSLAVKDAHHLATALGLDRLPDQLKRHRVAVRFEGNEGVGGNDARDAGIAIKAALAGKRHECAAVRSKRAIGCSCVVPWMRWSAIVWFHSSSVVGTHSFIILSFDRPPTSQVL
jgi:hypothetical protein